MLRAAIDIMLLLIVAYCTWMGSKKGIIGGVAGILAIIVSLYVGSLLSSAFSGEIIPAFRPFAGGIIESKESAVIEEMGYSGLSLEDIVAANPEEGLNYGINIYEALGIHPKRADDMAQKAMELAESEKIVLSAAVEDTLCKNVLYVGGTVFGAILVLILLTVIANLFNLRFHIPNSPKLDFYGGMGLGLLNGTAYCILICWILSFFGMFLGDVLSQSLLTRFYLLFDFLTGAIL